MTRQGLIILVVVLGLIGAGAAALQTLKARQELGHPGVRVVNEPTYGYDSRKEGTNGIFFIGSNSVFLPDRVLDYASRVEPVDKVVCDRLPRDTTYANRIYFGPDGFPINCQVVLMGADRTSIHKPQYCLQGTGWRIDSSEKTSIRIDLPGRYDLPVMKLLLSTDVKTPSGTRQSVRGIFVYWFVADNELTADHLERMWWLGRDLVKTGILQRWAYVICFAQCVPGQEAATFDRLKTFIAAAVPEFQLTAGPRADRPLKSAAVSH